MGTTRKRRVHSVSVELIRKSREAALTAVQVFNNPLVKFKSETFIVLMIIAWTYMLHSYFRQNKIEYRYYEQRGERRRFHRTKQGRYKYWELERCLNDKESPLDKATASNLRFLIALRNVIEHEMAMGLDNYLSGRYQACALNYYHYIRELFNVEPYLEQNLAYSIQFVELSREQVTGIPVRESVPENLQAFIADFDNGLNEDEYNSERYSYRLLFTRKLANRKGQADSVIEFIDPKSELGETIQTQYWFKKEVERPKFIPSEIVKLMRSEGYPKFNMHHHTVLWKELDGKNSGKGLGTCIANAWYWYESWLEIVREHCQENADLYT